MAAVATDTILDLIEQRRREEVVSAVCRVGEERGLDAAIELLASVQAEVGERWHTQRWTVADEHAA
ncbi:MAG: B12-binding domain-containing protein, partial [Acidimicrobiia bacterium]